MMIAILAAGMPVPTVGPLTAESLTKPNVDIRCNVLARDGVARKMRFRLNGPQGYPTGGSPAANATDPEFIVVEDETGTFDSADALYENLTQERFSGEWKDQKLGRFGRGRSLAYVRFFPAEEGTAALVVERQFPPMMSAAPRFSYAGVCNSTEYPQRPLSAPPSEKDRRK